jgi:hypothetical protein
MRPTKLSIGLAAALTNLPPGITAYTGPGYTPWVPLNYMQWMFNASVALIPSSDAATLACQGQYTPDPQDIVYARSISIARAAAVATVTDPGHGLTTGDGVTVYQSGSSALDGYQATVTVVNASTYTYPCANSGPTASGGNCSAVIARQLPITAITGTARVVAPLTLYMPVHAVRLNITTLTAGFVDFLVTQGSSS